MKLQSFTRSVRAVLPCLVALSLAMTAACRQTAPADDAKTGTPGMSEMAGMAGMSAAPTSPAGTPNDVTLTADQIAHGGVRWSPVSETTMTDAIDFPGHLVIDDDQTARLSPSMRGRVVDVKANVGDTISRGQALVILQSEEAAARRADVASATAEVTERQATLMYARNARERAERLLALKAGPAQDVERARADEAMAQAGQSQAESALAHAQTALSVLDVNPVTGLVELTSPIAGVVVTRDVMIGAVLEAGAPALVVSELSSLWLEFGAPPDVVTHLTPGQQIQFVVPTVSGTRDARILRVSGVLDPSTRLVMVRAVVANSSLALRPEMFASVRVPQGAAARGISVPHDAVQLIDERPVVFLVESDGHGGAKFTRRDVDTGTTIEGHTHIASGLHVGDIVVSDGAFAVKSVFLHAKMPMSMGG